MLLALWPQGWSRQQRSNATLVAALVLMVLDAKLHLAQPVRATLATAEKGRAVLEAAGRSLAQLLGEIDQLPPDTLTDKTAFG